MTEHDKKVIEAFKSLLEFEKEFAEAQTELDKIKEKHRQELIPYEDDCAEAFSMMSQNRQYIEELLRESGEYEYLVPGQYVDYKLTFSTPRASVIADKEATPDEWCAFEKKPKLKEIGDYLKSMPENERPNWASLKYGDSSLVWKSVKKKHD